MLNKIIKTVSLILLCNHLSPVFASEEVWRPRVDNFEWLSLKSDEWLKGEVMSMYNGSLEFDSKELDLLNLDMEDVTYLRTKRPFQVYFEHYGMVLGLLTIVEDTVIIINGANEIEYKRDDLVSFTPAGEKEIDLWMLKFSMGLSFKSGNSDQTDYNAKLNTNRRTARSRFQLDYIGNFSSVGGADGVRYDSVNNHRLSSSLDIYVTSQFFYTPLSGEAYKDPVQNIKHKLTLGAGLGYTLYDTKRFEWIVGGGPSALKTSYVSVQEGEESEVSSIALQLNTNFELEINKQLDLGYKYNIQASQKESGGYTHHMLTSLETEITKRLDFEISLQWDHISEPTENEQGERPKENDYSLLFGIAYEF